MLRPLFVLACLHGAAAPSGAQDAGGPIPLPVPTMGAMGRSAPTAGELGRVERLPEAPEQPPEPST